MKLNTVEVHSTFGPVQHISGFTVAENKANHNRLSEVLTGKNALKLGVCFFMMLAAFAIRMTTNSSLDLQAVGNFQADEAAPTDGALGSLRYVENRNKWTAPVQASDIELLQDSRMLRFSAAQEFVKACTDGKVLAVLQDEKYGTCIQISGTENTVLTLYGLETVAVKSFDSVNAGDLLGTIPMGRSVYLSIEKDGVAQDPTMYIDLSVQGCHAAL